ncbi:putative transcriptional regulatory protein [Colletotrichum trifolii]|uniref:Putative transcriptional regulatory protein n=1 Tax=Colletotrichum trifolii TaxID=5466 RepID=A0A4V3HXA9_COLTR|nr:putative transcriptional regulatory protein [Colletotrichum trifolii]
MSNYERSPATDMATVGNVPDEGARRTNSTQNTSRESLPGFWDMFGPPVKPLHSPSSDRAGGYSATSPSDGPRLPPAYGDRSFPSSSYFPPQDSHALSQPRSTYDSRHDRDRQTLQGLTRSFPGSGSPSGREPEYARRDSMLEARTGATWSLHQETGRTEYSVVSGDSHRSPRGPFGRSPYQYPGLNDVGSSYRDLPSSSGSGVQATTPAGNSNSEGLPSKDGLGPKIWNGTQFLPRFVRAAEVPGEGPCYFYDDGTHCKQVIDGEQVNAHWGVTKAGKPRKRLAIACVTCREKKIKCDPDFPRCVQCEKFGRQCKFKNAPRGGNNTSPSTPGAGPEDVRRMGGLPNPSDMRRQGSNSSASVSPRTTLRQPSPDFPMHQNKRLRLGFDSYQMTNEPPSSSRGPEVVGSAASAWHRQQVALPSIRDNLPQVTWQSDPYVFDPWL